MFTVLRKLEKFDLILASRSPRRSDLLRMIGLDFKICPSDVAEVYRDGLSPEAYALENAQRKAAAVAERYPASLIIAADTIVILNNEILEKPHDKQHAYEILGKLNGKTHQVITAFGLMLHEKAAALFGYEQTLVTFRKLSDEEIHSYIATREPFDKAGGYGAQGYGALLIQKIDGCFFNVVGLPIGRLYTMLSGFLMEF